MKLPAGWYVILESHEVKVREPLALTRFGLPLVAWRKQSGELVVMSDLCPHRKTKLSLGKIENDQIECPFHGLKFDGQGVCQWIPELGRGLPTVKTKTYPVVERLGWVWIHWRADEQPGAQPPWYRDLPESLHINSFNETWPVHFSRAVENQLDYAHLPFVHKSSIGRFAGSSKSKPQTEISEDRQKWYMRSPDTAYIEFVYPNIWQNRITASYLLTLAFVPVDDNTTKLYMRTHRKLFRIPPISWIVDFLDRHLNLWILSQDNRVVVNQVPNHSRGAQEILLESDKFIIHFRKWLEKSESP